MKEERIKELINKYKAGGTSTDEELYLQHNFEKLNREYKDVFNYICNNKLTPPENFNSHQWKSFEQKRKQKQLRKYSYISIAASIIVLIGLFLIKPSEKEMDITQKQALYAKALSMLDSAKDVEQKTILYEDDLVIIYTSN